MLDKQEIEELRQKLGFKDPGIFEKTAHALNLLPFLLEVYPDLIFKGGTSPLGTGDNTMSPFAPKLVDTSSADELLSLLDRKMMGEIKIESKKGKGIITIHGYTLFDETTLKIKPSAKHLLDQLCGFINKGSYPLEIIGHTDNRPAEEKGDNSQLGIVHTHVHSSRQIHGGERWCNPCQGCSLRQRGSESNDLQ